jgi:hypothetical protein
VPLAVGAALVASADAYTPRATQLLDGAREKLGTIHEIAGALAEDLPAPKTGPSRSRRRRRKKKPGVAQAVQPTGEQPTDAEAAPPGEAPSRPKRRRRRPVRAPAATESPGPDA